MIGEGSPLSRDETRRQRRHRRVDNSALGGNLSRLLAFKTKYDSTTSLRELERRAREASAAARPLLSRSIQCSRIRAAESNTCHQRAEAWGRSKRVEEWPRSQPDDLPRSLVAGALETVEGLLVIAEAEVNERASRSLRLVRVFSSSGVLATTGS